MRKMGPLSAEHPLVEADQDGGPPECAACKKPFAAGDYVTLVDVGPGEDRDARIHRDFGEAYNSVAVPVHWECSPQGPE